jgi:S1-C subfamily serine protease
MRLLPNRNCIHATILVVAIACLLPSGTAQGKAVSIDVRDSFIDIEASETALAVILQALSEKIGLSLNLGRPLTEAFSCDLKKVTLAATSFYDRSGVGNILITGISEESPLRVIGLRPGDVIQNVNGKTAGSVQELLQYLGSLPDNMRLVRIQRGNNAYPLYINHE